MKTAYEEFKELTDDVERWKWLRDNPDADYMVLLDNDDTIVLFDDENDIYVDIDWYVGCKEGIQNLLEAMGIKAECV